jgi:hypothetical protein
MYVHMGGIQKTACGGADRRGNHTEICSTRFAGGAFGAICLTNIPMIKFLPCNHDSFCIACSNTLVAIHPDLLTCPYCRSNVHISKMCVKIEISYD